MALFTRLYRNVRSTKHKFYFFCKKHFSTVSVCQHSWYTHQIAWFCASDFQKICRCVMIKRPVIITQPHEGKDRPIYTSQCISYVRLITYARTYLLTQPDGNLKSPLTLNKRHASSETPPHVTGREGSSNTNGWRNATELAYTTVLLTQTSSRSYTKHWFGTLCVLQTNHSVLKCRFKL